MMHYTHYTDVMKLVMCRQSNSALFGLSMDLVREMGGFHRTEQNS